MVARDPRDRIGNVPGCIEDVIGKKTGTDVLISSRIGRAFGESVPGKIESWKRAVLRCVNRKPKRRRIERITRISIRDVEPRKSDIQVVQKCRSKRVVVLHTNKNRFEQLIESSLRRERQREAGNRITRDAIVFAMREAAGNPVFVRRDEIELRRVLIHVRGPESDRQVISENS